jgi:hypothetical protein
LRCTVRAHAAACVFPDIFLQFRIFNAPLLENEVWGWGGGTFQNRKLHLFDYLLALSLDSEKIGILPTVNFKIAPQMSGFLSNFCSVERFFVDVLQRKLANNK